MNRVARIIVATLGSIFGFSGMGHGFFEILQGDVPTEGVFISAIGEAQRMWPHGNEYAVTLIPNFLISGITAMLVGLALIVWSIGFVHRKNGALILLLLFILLLLAGGGVAQILFFPWVYLVSTQINKPLAWWRRVLPARLRMPLGRLWRWGLVTGSALLVFALLVAITGFVPTVSDPEAVLATMLVCLAAEVVVLPLTFVAGFACDLATRS